MPFRTYIGVSRRMYYVPGSGTLVLWRFLKWSVRWFLIAVLVVALIHAVSG